MYASHSAVSFEIASPSNSVPSAPISKKLLSMLMFSVLPNRRGRVNRFTSAPVVQQVADQARLVDIVKSLRSAASSKLSMPTGSFNLSMAQPPLLRIPPIPFLTFIVPQIFARIASRWPKDNEKPFPHMPKYHTAKGLHVADK